jgi:hypothetical protein
LISENSCHVKEISFLKKQVFQTECLLKESQSSNTELSVQVKKHEDFGSSSREFVSTSLSVHQLG